MEVEPFHITPAANASSAQSCMMNAPNVPCYWWEPNWLGATEEAINRTQKMARSRFIDFVADCIAMAE